MITLSWILLSFLFGAIPFSVWLTRLFLGKDNRAFGDGNPGATNVFRAGSPILGMISLLLDVGKAALPVGICFFRLELRGIGMFAIAIAPILGHMFSPFLGFKGGKALAAALGMWIGLSIWQLSLPAVLGVVLGILILSRTGWAVMFSMVVVLLTILIWLPQPLYFWIWAAETSLLAYSHRSDLSFPPAIHPRIQKHIQRNR